jgi:hypothetical protein
LIASSGNATSISFFFMTPAMPDLQPWLWPFYAQFPIRILNEIKEIQEDTGLSMTLFAH